MAKKPSPLDPRKLRPGELLRMLNSTPLGEVIGERQLLRHRQRAGSAIGDESTIDFFRYLGWLVRQRHFPPAAPQRTEASADEGYEAHKARARDRAATLSQSGRDIGELPPIENPQRRADALKDLDVFCKTYLPHTFGLDWSPDHHVVLGRMETVTTEGGLYALAMPRGSGKTSLAEAGALRAILSGQRQFVVLIGASKRSALDMLATIKSELETNELLCADFPEICIPFRALEGLPNRAPGQLHQGKRTHIVYGKDVLVLPTIPGSAAGGAILKAYGLNAAIRGAKFRRPDGKTVRPDLVLLDDPQTDQSARSVSQCETRERLINGAVLGLAGPGKSIAALMLVTVVREGDLADTYLDRTKYPQWQGQRFKLLYEFPADLKLWAEYAELRAEELRNDGDGRQATAFYRRHRKAMDGGARPAWPERHRADELSAVQHAMNLWYDDPVAFAAEFQNEPLPETTAEEESLTVTVIVAKAANLERGVVPLWATRLTAGVDVQGKLLYWQVCAWREDTFTGHVVDYGAWPDQGRPYFTLRDAQRTIAHQFKRAAFEARMLAALNAVEELLLDREWRTEAGGVTRIERLLVDANWGKSTDVVYQYCRQSKHPTIVMPAHGKYVGARSMPFANYKKAPGDRVGHHWRVPSTMGRRALRHVLIDANFWKTFVVARIQQAAGDHGSLSLFGAPRDHRCLAEHLTAEKGVTVEADGRQIVEWKQIPGRDNHWLDTLVGNYVAASMLGVRLSGEDGARQQRSGGQRMKLSDMQRQKRGGR